MPMHGSGLFPNQVWERRFFREAASAQEPSVGAVVVRDIPDDVVAVGVPARVSARVG
jgi:hypothetical protein